MMDETIESDINGTSNGASADGATPSERDNVTETEEDVANGSKGDESP